MTISQGRWEVYRPRSGQHPTDALENWMAKTGAQVDWASTSRRTTSNKVVHTVVPYLSCTKCHPLLDHHGRTLALPYTDPRQVDSMIAECVRKWAAVNTNYGLTGYWPCFGRDGMGQHVVSIMICYNINYLPIQDCLGEGPDVKTAKAIAAQRLLDSGHCMIRLA